MRAQLFSLAVIVVITSFVTALGLVYLPRAEPQRQGFVNRFRYFFGRSIIMVGIWSTVFWFLFGRTPAAHP